MFCCWMRMQSNYNCALFLLQVSTVKQIVSMETLKELLHKHERVKLDDPQDRGDLYLLAPMRLLTPILEEEELQADAEPNFNRSVMTVISELLTNHSKSMQVNQRFYTEYQFKNAASYLLSAICRSISHCQRPGPLLRCRMCNPTVGSRTAWSPLVPP